jgi:hypothetical protein
MLWPNNDKLFVTPNHPTLVRTALALASAILILAVPVAGHGVEEGDADFLENNEGLAVGPFLYLGAKHMVTGYDHLLFLVGVIFFLYKSRDVVETVTLFTIGHSITLLVGVLGDVKASSYLIDAIIGLSVTYKGLDNLGYWKTWFGRQPSTRVAVFLFGLVHGFGLATKVQDLTISNDGLVGNIISFNVGVELGQALALGVILIAMSFWRRFQSYRGWAVYTNGFLILAGLVLFVLQLLGYFGIGNGVDV